MLTRAAGDGALVLAGQLGQNLLVRNTPALPIPGGMGDLAKDVLALVVGSFAASKALGGDKARLFIAGQVAAIGGRIVRGLNIPVVSAGLSGYDAINLGTYTTARRLPPAPARTRTLSGVGVYVDSAASVAMP